MADLSDRHKHWDERAGLVAVGHLPMRDARRALTRSLPTMDHALRLFDAVVDRLGERGWIDPEGGEQRRRLLVRDPDDPAWLVPTPLIEHAWSGTRGEFTIASFVNSGAVLPADAPEGWKPGDPWFGDVDPEPEVYPRGPTMAAGDLSIAVGASHWRILYDDRGLKFETHESATDSFTAGRYDGIKPYTVDPLARPPTPAPMPLLCRADLDAHGHAVDELAQFIVELDAPAGTPVRVRLPMPIPGGAEGAWARACAAIREALWSGRIAEEARFVVADGFDGSAVAWGATRDEALTRWDDVVRQLRPKPPGWKAEPEREEPTMPTGPGPSLVRDEENKTLLMSTGVITLTAPVVGSVPWPMPLPKFTPAVLVPLPPRPDAIPPHLHAAGFTRWIRLLGADGRVSHALSRDDGDLGFMWIGEGVVDLVDDPASLEREMDAVDEAERAQTAELVAHGLHNPWSDTKQPCRLVSYRLWDDGWRKRIPASFAGGQWGEDLSARGLDGGVHRWLVTRQRWQR